MPLIVIPWNSCGGCLKQVNMQCQHRQQILTKDHPSKYMALKWPGASQDYNNTVVPLQSTEIVELPFNKKANKSKIKAYNLTFMNVPYYTHHRNLKLLNSIHGLWLFKLRSTLSFSFMLWWNYIWPHIREENYKILLVPTGYHGHKPELVEHNLWTWKKAPHFKIHEIHQIWFTILKYFFSSTLCRILKYTAILAP